MHRDKRGYSSLPLFLMGAMLFTSLIVLGIFRFQASQLEYDLGQINKSIERYASEELKLRQDYSALASPIKIYRECKDLLGMDKPKMVEAIRVDAPRVAEIPKPQSQKELRSSVLSFFGFLVN